MDLAEDFLYDLNEYGVQDRLGGSVNLGDWFKVSDCDCVTQFALMSKCNWEILPEKMTTE